MRPTTVSRNSVHRREGIRKTFSLKKINKLNSSNYKSKGLSSFVSREQRRGTDVQISILGRDSVRCSLPVTRRPILLREDRGDENKNYQG